MVASRTIVGQLVKLRAGCLPALHTGCRGTLWVRRQVDNLPHMKRTCLHGHTPSVRTVKPLEYGYPFPRNLFPIASTSKTQPPHVPPLASCNVAHSRVASR